MATGNETGRRNAQRIVKTIWKNPMISRGEIADRLKLERSTITLQVSRLLDLGLVSELSEGRAGPNGGRRPIQLGINKDYGYVLGIDSRSDSYAVVAMNMAGETLRYRREESPFASEPISFAEQVEGIARSFAGDLGGGRLLGVGLAAGSEAAGGMGELVSARLGASVAVATGAQCCAWGELAFRKADGPMNFLFALVRSRDDGRIPMAHRRTDLDLGIVIDGKVHAGSELSPVQPHGAYRSPSSLARHLALFANAFVFDTVFVGGDVGRLGDGFLKTLENEMARARSVPSVAPRKAAYATLGDRAVAYGAAGMQIYRIFSRIES